MDKQTSCVYDAKPEETRFAALKRKFGQLEQETEAHEDFIRLLKADGESSAVDIVRRVRSGEGVSSIVSRGQDGVTSTGAPRGQPGVYKWRRTSAPSLPSIDERMNSNDAGARRPQPINTQVPSAQQITPSLTSASSTDSDAEMAGAGAARPGCIPLRVNTGQRSHVPHLRHERSRTESPRIRYVGLHPQTVNDAFFRGGGGQALQFRPLGHGDQANKMPIDIAVVSDGEDGGSLASLSPSSEDREKLSIGYITT